MNPPRVYFAGKINKNCWRHVLVPGLRDHHWGLGPIRLEHLTYVGPFFVGCDHGCYHQPKSHGAVTGCWPDRDAERMAVIDRCTSGVDQCDVFLAYIDALDCYGTVAEIERAIIGNKYVVVAFAPGTATPKNNEFWFTTSRAHRVEFGVEFSNLQQLVSSVLESWR
jgi:hypothetical protein